RVDHLVYRRVAHRFPGRKALAQRLEPAIAVDVGRVLAQDGAHQLVNRREVLAPFRVAVEVFEQPGDDLVLGATFGQSLRGKRRLDGRHYSLSKISAVSG